MTLSPLPPKLDPADDWVEVLRDKINRGRWNKITSEEITRAGLVVDALVAWEDANFEFTECICGTTENEHPDDDSPGTRCLRLALIRLLRTPL